MTIGAKSRKMIMTWHDTYGNIDGYCSYTTFDYNFIIYLEPLLGDQCLGRPFPYSRPPLCQEESSSKTGSTVVIYQQQNFFWVASLLFLAKYLRNTRWQPIIHGACIILLFNHQHQKSIFKCNKCLIKSIRNKYKKFTFIFIVELALNGTFFESPLAICGNFSLSGLAFHFKLWPTCLTGYSATF